MSGVPHLDHPPEWEAFDADGDGALSPEEEAAYNEALEAWWHEKEQLPGPEAFDADGDGDLTPEEQVAYAKANDRWWDMKVWSDVQRSQAESRGIAAAKRYAWRQRPLSERARIRAKSALLVTSKAVVWTIAAILFVIASLIVSSLLGGPGCLTPWFSC